MEELLASKVKLNNVMCHYVKAKQNSCPMILVMVKLLVALEKALHSAMKCIVSL